jgi:hypothetical protein
MKRHLQPHRLYVARSDDPLPVHAQTIGWCPHCIVRFSRPSENDEVSVLLVLLGNTATVLHNTSTPSIHYPVIGRFNGKRFR